ncbi:helix-turn-helix transcriptional regulator [Candidatus Rhodoblastus alkanivorans]|uniref:helix-turn-helix transcriptional regulator n=1 Tax=Candidatus Rhodoblastus alkanivorans TaxID=2954117 RepID=UPI0023512F38|nr:LuxR C-terminal-related transcriptional regulator [Candidatus Rhodoblastus alkanivorans]
MASYKEPQGQPESFAPCETPAADEERAADDLSGPSAPISETNGVDSLFARQTRMVFDLLQTAVEEAAETAESRNVKVAAELHDLQLRALRSLHESALATVELFEALSAAQTPGELARRQIALARRQGESVSERLQEFFLSARKIATAMTAPPTPADRGPAEKDDNLFTRLDRLTARQKGVLELLAQGLPNKVIAHRLGISETTVKAHVGEILRKLKVYNRARAIAMLAQIDATRIGAVPDGEA